MKSSLTSSELRTTNRRSVLHTVYEQKEISKQGLAQSLHMSLPTVTQNLKELEEMGLIDRRGLYESTGGRKAQIYHFVADARIAIGVLLLKEFYRIVAVDLYGQVQHSEIISIPFSRSPEYFRDLADHVNAFADRLEYGSDRILGVCFALQGLVSPDGQTVIFGEILGCTGLTLDELQADIHYPCTMIHDTEASATAELWEQKDLKNAVLLLLTRNFGGALITDGSVHHGTELNSDVIEHMRLYPGGRPCYCGRQGCIETYCSAHALACDAGEPLDAFFRSLRAGENRQLEIWQTYLKNLALAINNIRMLFDSEYIIGGYLLQFMTNQDFEQLTEYVNQECSFHTSGIHIRPSVYSDDAAAPGAAISLVKEFLESL